jgi:hypothetical protein
MAMQYSGVVFPRSSLKNTIHLMKKSYIIISTPSTHANIKNAACVEFLQCATSGCLLAPALSTWKQMAFPHK